MPPLTTALRSAIAANEASNRWLKFVLIWHLRGYAQATRRLDLLDSLTLSAVSYMEVLQGLRDKTEFGDSVKDPGATRCPHRADD